MPIEKIDNQRLSDENRFHSNLPDIPKMSADQMKEFMDYVAKQVIIPKVNEIIDALPSKADTQSVYTKAETDGLLLEKADVQSVYTKNETDTALLDKADIQSVYTKQETEEILMQKASLSQVYTKQMSDSKYSNALIGKKEGITVSVDDVSPVTHLVEVRLKSKNLIPITKVYDETINGISVKSNADGSITFNGTASTDADLRLLINDGMPVYAEKGTYMLSGCPQGGSTSTYWIAAHNAVTGYDFYSTEGGKGINIVLDKAQKLYFTIRITKGTTVSNLVFKPMLEKGSQRTAYTPYTDDFSKMIVLVSKKIDNVPSIEKLVFDQTGFEQLVESCENMEFSCESAGVVIDVRYLQDLNKVIDRLNEALS